MSDPLRKVQPGQRVEIPAAAYNAFIDAANAERGRQHNIVTDAERVLRSSTIIRVRNQTGQPAGRFFVLELSTPIVLPAGNINEFARQVAMNAVVPSGTGGKTCVILLEPLVAGAIGWAVVTGAVPVIVDVVNVQHQFANPAGGITENLVSATSGMYRIIWRNAGSGERWAIVATGHSASTPAIVFQLTTTLNAGIGQTASAQVVISSNAADYPVGQTVAIYNTGLSKGVVGARGIAMLFNGVWWVYQLNQPTILARFLLTGNTHSPGSGDFFGDTGSQITIAFSNFTAITPYPYGLTPTAPITNPSNLIAFSGDSGLCFWDTATEQYVLIAVYPALIRRFYFRLGSNWPNGLDQASNIGVCLHSDTATQGGNLVGGSLMLRDRWNVASNAKTNDIGSCQLNYKSGQFDIIEISHVCRIGRAQVYTDFSGKPSTFQVWSVEGFDGRSPTNSPGEPLTVHNELGVESGKEGESLEIRWNPLQGRYYALPKGSKGKVFPVLLEQTGGSQGTSTAPASWSYTVRDEETNQILASNVNPVNAPHRWQRPSVGQMIKATFGYAHYSSSGSPQLVVGWINEVTDQQACETDDGGPGPPVVQDFPTADNPAIDFQAALLEQ